MPPQILNSLQAQAALKELERRRESADRVLFSRKPVPLSKYDIDFFLSRCHEAQKAILKKVIFESITRLALLCPRRTGKSFLMLMTALIIGRRFPGCNIAYVVPTSKQHAKRLFWNPLMHMDHQLNLKLDFKIAEHMVVTPEGSRFYVFGAKNADAPKILRGDAWAAALLDESKDFGVHFEELIIEAVLPGLEDYNGLLALGGTPGPILDGLFYKITDPVTPPEGWYVAKWDKSVNTFLAPEKRDLDLIERKEYWPFGLTKESPKFKREQLALWVADDTERVYLYDVSRNGCKFDHDTPHGLPPGHTWYFCLGLDLGERDANAFVIFAFAMTTHECFVVCEFARPRMSIDEIAGKTRSLIEEFGDMAVMVADTGGYGRGIVTDLQERHNLAFESADKTGNKLGNIAQMNSDFLCGRIKARDDGPLATEWKRLVRRIRPKDQKVLISHSDLGDAALYAWRACKHYASAEKIAEPTVGTLEWHEREERRAVDAALKRRSDAAGNGQWWGPAITDY